MRQSQLIFKNLLAGGVSTAVGGFLQLLAFIVIARHAPVATFGRFSSMVAFAFVIQKVADMGISSILIRDMAVDAARIATLLGSALSLSWVIGIACAGVMFGAIPFLPFDHRTATLTAVMGVGGLTQFQVNCYGSVLRAQEENEFYAAGFVLHKISLVILVVAAIIASASLAALVAAYTLASLAQWLFLREIVVRRYGRPRLRFDIQLWRYLIGDSVALGAAGAVRLFTEQVDILMLSWLVDPRSVGLFSGPYRLTAGLRLIPVTMMMALFPLYSRSALEGESSREFQRAYQRGLKAFVLAALPISLLFVLAPQAITVGLLGEHYASAAPVLRYLGAAPVLVFVSASFPFILTALNQQTFVLESSAVALCVRVLLDLALIRRLGYLAPCISLSIAETVLVAIWMLALFRKGCVIELKSFLLPAVVGCLAMGAIVYAFNPVSLVSLCPVALMGSAVYGGVVFYGGGMSREERKLAREGLGFLRVSFFEWSRST
jgi:O-antigen/teichoic acid export membrane protein